MSGTNAKKAVFTGGETAFFISSFVFPNLVQQFCKLGYRECQDNLWPSVYRKKQWAAVIVFSDISFFNFYKITNSANNCIL